MAVEVRAGCSAPWPTASDAAPDLPLLLALVVGGEGAEPAPGAVAGAGADGGVDSAAAAGARLEASRSFVLRMMLRLHFHQKLTQHKRVHRGNYSTAMAH